MHIRVSSVAQQCSNAYSIVATSTQTCQNNGAFLAENFAARSYCARVEVRFCTLLLLWQEHGQHPHAFNLVQQNHVSSALCLPLLDKIMKSALLETLIKSALFAETAVFIFSFRRLVLLLL
jgi:hypothetical protein